MCGCLKLLYLDNEKVVSDCLEILYLDEDKIGCGCLESLYLDKEIIFQLDNNSLE